MRRLSVEDRLESVIVDPDTGCWWPPQKPNAQGYVRVSVAGVDSRHHPMHVLAYEHFHGPVPEGMDLDHLCHTADKSCEGGFTCPHRRCCNPSHLEPVSSRENYYRGRAAGFLGRRQSAKTSCPQGHGYTPDNTRVTPRGSRICRTCHRESARRKNYWR